MFGRRLFAVCVLNFSVALPSFAQTWTIDPHHSNAQFAVRHMMVSTVRGEFSKLSGTVLFDGKDISKSSVDITIDASSISPRVEDRDNHLKSADFFEVAKFPTIPFTSKKATAAGDGRFSLVGDLTIRGVTREVTLDVEGPSPAIKDQRGYAAFGFRRRAEPVVLSCTASPRHVRTTQAGTIHCRPGAGSSG